MVDVLIQRQLVCLEICREPLDIALFPLFDALDLVYYGAAAREVLRPNFDHLKVEVDLPLIGVGYDCKVVESLQHELFPVLEIAVEK